MNDVAQISKAGSWKCQGGCFALLTCGNNAYSSMNDLLPQTAASGLCSQEDTMIDKAELCEKIRELYPDIGQCGIDIDVAYDQQQERWVVDLKKDNHRLKTFLEEGDAEFCLMGRQCVGLGIEIAQLRDNIQRN
jgi:hypothetical protein